MISFIISIDNSYAMTNNFFSLFLQDMYVLKNEVVIILDGVLDQRIIDYCNTLQNDYNNILLLQSTKVGYGVANNIAVRHSAGEYLFFINCDVFAEEGCFEKMVDTLLEGKADCVQPLLLYPQSNLVQCAGTFFGPYYKEHLFEGNKSNAPIVLKEANRQALTSALYAMKRSTFDEFNGFDKFYFNKIESFELSYKITLSGKENLYLPSAKAWHSRGGGRKQYVFDFNQQEAYFWSRFGAQITEDLSSYINAQLPDILSPEPYYTVIMNQLRSWKEILAKTPIEIQELIEMPWLPPGTFNLWDLFPHELLKYRGNLLLVVESIQYLKNNLLWFKIRNNPHDIAIDKFANAVNILQYLT